MRVKNAARTERRKGDAVTIHEVARHAGVSPMTVSRVMNSNSNVREATRELVMRAVRELNYTPNAAARSLAAAQGTRIALIYTNPSAAYLSELLVGALAGAARTAAQLVLDTWDHMSHAAERAAARKIAQSVAGVDSAAAAVRVEGRTLGAGRGRYSGRGDCVRSLPAGFVQRAHRRFPREPGNDRAPDLAWVMRASRSFAAIRIRPPARCATTASRRP